MEAFTPNGLREAVKARGSVRLLPGSVFDLRGGAPLIIDSGTHIQGEATILTSEGSHVSLFCSDASLRGLRIVHTGKGTSVRGHHTANRNDDLTLEGVRMELGEGDPFSLAPGSNQAIRGCRFVSDSMTATALRLAGGKGLIFEDNFVRWRTARCQLTFQEGATIRKNRFEVDGDHHSLGRQVTGGVELSFGYEVLFQSNLVEWTGKPSMANNDAEMVVTEPSDIAEWMGAGKVLAVGSYILTDMKWGAAPWLDPKKPKSRRKVIHVLSGAAVGQWRWATPGKDGEVIPETSILGLAKGDEVCVSSVPAYRVRMIENQVIGGRVGLQFYNGALECQMLRNVAPAGIEIRSDSRKGKRAGVQTIEHLPVWYTTVQGNVGPVVNADHDVSDTQLPASQFGNDIPGPVNQVNEVRGGKVLQERVGSKTEATRL